MKRGFILIFVLACFLKVTGQSTGKYQIKFLEVNKKNSDYGVAILDENKLIFTSADHKVTSARKNYNPRKDLYKGDIDFDGEIKNVKRITEDVNKRVNQTGVTYTNDRRTVYFSRNKYKKKLKKQKLAKNQRLILYKADVAADGSWKNIKKLPFNKKKFSTGYPVLSPDNSKLYFVSDRLPSKGNTDIFVVDILKGGKYSNPRNLGSFVNTKGNETTPFVTDQNILYFSSDGHEGMGKLDVYAVEMFENSTSEVYNLASPINSINDDFAYIVNKDNNLGFFTSNRLQGKDFNDLYSFTLEEDVRPGECFITVDGKVRDKDSYKAISGATVELYDIDGSLLESVDTYSDGTYQFVVSCAREYELIASNPDYLDDKKRIEILEENYHSALHTNLNLARIERKKAVVETLSPIYYEFDDANITNEAAKEMDRIADIMIENKNLVIEASSYTDSRGSEAYNEQLSKRRAKAAVEYLKSKGIEAGRIKSKAYGENKLINQCVNGVECREEAHQMNRRTEFNFVNVPSKTNQPKSKPQKTKVAVKEQKRVAPVPTKSQAIEKQPTVANVELSKVQEIIRDEPVEQEVTRVIDEAKPIENSSKETLEVVAADVQIQTPSVIEERPKIVAPVVEKPEEKEVVAVTEINKGSNSVAPVIEKSKEEAVVSETEEQETIAVSSKDKEALITETEISEEKASQKKEEIMAEKIETAQLASSEKNKVQNAEVKEAVIINYNSTIVATNPESNKVLNYIGTEKVKMIDQLSELEKKYAEAVPKYPKISDSLLVEKAKITSLIADAKELEETGWSNIIEYKNNVLHFKKKYRDLMVRNGRNNVSGSSTRRERQLAHASRSVEKNTEPDKTVTTQSAPKVALMEENLSVDNIEITAMKKNGNGKYQKTNNANKTDLIKVTFKLLHNEKVGSGRKEAHLVLQNPEGKVEEAKGIFTMKDSEKESKYTDHAIINYNNHDVDVTMFIQRKGRNFEKGVYPVKVFLERELMAVTKLNLQNPY